MVLGEQVVVDGLDEDHAKVVAEAQLTTLGLQDNCLVQMVYNYLHAHLHDRLNTHLLMELLPKVKDNHHAGLLYYQKQDRQLDYYRKLVLVYVLQRLFLSCLLVV